MAVLDDALTALRTRLLTVPGLPALRLWENIIPDATPGNLDTYTQDTVTMGTKRALSLPTGPSGARWWVWDGCLYQVSLYYPANTHLHGPLGMAAAVATAFDASSLTASGGLVRLIVESVRVPTALGTSTGITLPVQIRFRIEHFTS